VRTILWCWWRYVRRVKEDRILQIKNIGVRWRLLWLPFLFKKV